MSKRRKDTTIIELTQNKPNKSWIRFHNTKEAKLKYKNTISLCEQIIE